MSDFSKAYIGDKVYSLQYGYGLIKDSALKFNVDFPIKVTFVGIGDRNFTQYGHLTYCAMGRNIPDLYWDRPTIIEPEAPKRMVTKTITKYLCINTRSGASVGLYDNLEKAEDTRGYYKSRYHSNYAVVILTGEYQIEE